MKNKCRFGVVAAFVVVSGTLLAQTGSNDIVNCKWRDGREMDQENCDFFRRIKATDEAEGAAHEARLKAMLDKQREERDSVEKASKEFQISELKRIQERDVVDRQKRAANKAVEDDRFAREEQKQQAKQAAIQSSLKSQCGDAYRRPSIGLSVEKFKLCVAPIREVGQLNRADGVVTTFQGSGYIVHAMSGRVIAWNR